MGCNYYIMCNHCNHIIIHIGKSVNNREFLSNLTKSEIIKRLSVMTENETLRNEYNQLIKKEDFFKIIPDNFVLIDGNFC